jgi:hypothetical protein
MRAVSDPFGHSLALTDGDLVLGGDGRLAQVTGRDNLRQALSLRVLTPARSDQFQATYGLDAAAIFSVAATPRLVRELIKLELVRTLSGDPRVREVAEVVFPVPASESQRAWRVDVEVTTTEGAERFDLELRA